MTLWKVTVTALHRGRFAKSHSDEDTLVSYLFTRTKEAAARWSALETIVVVSRYDRGGDFYWDDARKVEETEEFKAPVRRRRRWRGWPAHQAASGRWYSRDGKRLSEREARRRNHISLTLRSRRRAKRVTEKGIPEAPALDTFYREFSPYATRDAFAPSEPPRYTERPEDEDTIERLHEEYDELEAGGSPGGPKVAA